MPGVDGRLATRVVQDAVRPQWAGLRHETAQRRGRVSVGDQGSERDLIFVELERWITNYYSETAAICRSAPGARPAPRVLFDPFETPGPSTTSVGTDHVTPTFEHALAAEIVASEQVRVRTLA